MEPLRYLILSPLAHKNSAFIYAYEVKIAGVNCLYSFPLDIE